MNAGDKGDGRQFSVSPEEVSHMRRFIIFFLIGICLWSSVCQSETVENTYIWAPQGEVCYFEKDGLIGLMKTNGEVLIEPRFTNTKPFYFNIAVVEENGLLGAITDKGEVLIEPVHQWDALYFMGTAINKIMHHETLIYEKERKFGFVTLDGVIHEEVWDYISPFVGGTAVVKRNNQYNLIDTQGRILCQEWYSKINYDYDQLSSSFLAQDAQGKYGALGPAGEVLVSFEWDYIGKADDCYIVGKDEKKGILNSKGELRATLEWDDISSFYVKSGDPLMARKGGKWGFIDLDGNQVIPFLWDNVYAFSQGVAKVETDNLSGFINKEGEYVIPLQRMVTDDYFDSDETVCFTDINDINQWGYMDRNGNILCKVNYQHYMGEPIKQEGLSVVIKGKKDGYMDIYGNMVFPFQWELADGFSNGLAFVGDGEAWAVINNKGEYVTDYIWAMPGCFEQYDEMLLSKVCMRTDTGFVEGYIDQNGQPICGVKLPVW